MKRALVYVAGAMMLAGPAAAAESSSVEVYGHVMLDAGFNVDQIDPLWFDVMRPTKLPAVEDQFAPDGNTYMGVRQTRFGVRSSTPTKLGDLKTQFEFELFGTGVDAGQTTFRLRHAYGELGQFGAGQYWSPFMDIDVFPNSLEYWGPNGMVFYRNVQVRWMPIQRDDARLTVALERPGASADQGTYDERIEEFLAGEEIRAHFPLPDLSAEYRITREWGYVEVAGILRHIEWEHVDPGPVVDLSGNDTGWGINVSSNLKLGDDDTARLQAVYGEGIQNYMNDAPVDIAVVDNPGSTTQPVKGKALPVLGVVAFLDHTWNEKFSTSVGYSLVNIENTDQQDTFAFKRGHYALANLLYYPVPNLTTGVEAQFGARDNRDDDFEAEGLKFQFSAKYAFSKFM